MESSCLATIAADGLKDKRETQLWCPRGTHFSLVMFKIGARFVAVLPWLELERQTRLPPDNAQSQQEVPLQ